MTADAKITDQPPRHRGRRNPQHLSESVELYTPALIVEPSRRVLGRIDLDPASSPIANELVQARRIFTANENGLLYRWWGNVFLNPPGGIMDEDGVRVIRAKNAATPGCTETGECGLPPGHSHKGVESAAVRWWCELATEWAIGRVKSAIFVGFSLELLQRTQQRDGLCPLDFPCCIPKKRIPFDHIVNGVRVSGKQPTHANVIVCLPPRSDPRGSRFEAEFSPLGKVVRP